jgi:hypothetical protein
MNKVTKMDSCRKRFKSIKILPLYSQNIFSLLMYGLQKNIYLQET